MSFSRSQEEASQLTQLCNLIDHAFGRHTPSSGDSLLEFITTTQFVFREVTLAYNAVFLSPILSLSSKTDLL